MSVITELVAKFGFDIDSKPLKDLEEGISAVKAGLIGLAGSGAASAFAIYEMAKSTAESREEMLLLSQQAGLTVEAFSSLKFAAGLLGVGADELTQSVGFLSRNMYRAQHEGGQVARAFVEAGVSSEKLRSGTLNADQAMQLIANRFASMKDGPEKTALSMELFGRAGRRMIPFLNQGAAGLQAYRDTAEQLGLVLSKENAEKAHELVQSTRLLEAVIVGIKNTVAGGMIPAFTQIVQESTKWIVLHREIIKTNLTGFVKGLTAYIRAGLPVARAFFSAFVDVVRIFHGAETATKLFLGAIGVLSSASILFGIGKLVQAGWGLAAAFEAADAAAALWPTLIGAGIALLLLGLEDIIAFFQGRDSVTGILIEKMTPSVAKFKEWIDSELLPPIKKFIDTVNQLLQLAGLAPTNGAQFAGSGGGSWGTSSGLPTATQAQIASISSPSASVPGGGSSDPNALPGWGSGTQNFDVTVSVQTPPSADAAKVAGTVGEATKEGIDQALRDAKRWGSSGRTK